MSKTKAFLQRLADEPPPCVTINDPELFFPKGWGDEHTFQIRQAKAVCRTCPLVANCMEFALDTEDQHAILAATTPGERELIRKKLAEQDRLNELGAAREFEAERKSWRQVA